MRRPKMKTPPTLIDRMLSETSWLLSHAQALSDYGRVEEAATELARAGASEEQVACLLEAHGQELEAAIHRVSAASCYEKLGEYVRAVTLLRAALSAPLENDYRGRVERLLARCLKQGQKELRRVSTRKMRSPSSVIC